MLRHAAVTRQSTRGGGFAERASTSQTRQVQPGGHVEGMRACSQSEHEQPGPQAATATAGTESLYELDPLDMRDLAKGASLRRQAHAALVRLGDACATDPRRCHLKVARQTYAQARHVNAYIVGSGMQETEDYANTLEELLPETFEYHQDQDAIRNPSRARRRG